MNWDEVYQNQSAETLPWHLEALDSDLEKALKTLKIVSGKVLDLGTGAGTQGTALAQQGFEVIGSDIASTAVEIAKKRLEGKNLPISFIRDNILKTRLEGPFDFVFDRGCFHTLPPEGRNTYVETVHRLLKPAGYLFLKTFSHKEPWDGGPYRFHPQELRELFSPCFNIVSITDSAFVGNRKPEPMALFSILQRKNLK